MDERRPKRRRDKDNPYTLNCRDGSYYITFKDGQSVDQCIEISEELFQVFDRFELDDLRHIHVVERHMEHSVVYEKTLYKRSGRYEESAEDEVIWELTVRELHSAISLLPEVQKRRLVLRYFAGMTYKQIAEMFIMIRMECNMTDMNPNAVLRYALENEIINLAYIQEQVEEMQKNEILSHHPYKIWEGKDGKWYTYLPDKERGRVLKKRSTEQGIKQVVIDYWKDKLDNPTVEEVFTEWNDRKLELKKISEATHLRNIQIYKRHFGEFGKRKIKCITPEEVEEFLEEQIPEHNLKAKAFSNLKTVTRGMLKRAKKRKLISFNVTEIFNDLDVSDKDFAPTIINMEEEVFDESEMPEVIEWLESQKKTLLNLGILLLFVTGVRIGELSAFEWDDWDGCAFHIHRTETRYQDASGKYVYDIKEYPKTPAGVRSAVVPPHCIWIVKEIRKLNPFGKFVFEQNGTRIKTYSFRRKLYRICNNIKITKKSPHKVRKTYASILLDNQIPDKNIIELMGHTDITCTKEFYSRDRRSNEKKAELLDAIPEFRIGIM